MIATTQTAVVNLFGGEGLKQMVFQNTIQGYHSIIPWLFDVRMQSRAFEVYQKTQYNLLSPGPQANMRLMKESVKDGIH